MWLTDGQPLKSGNDSGKAGELSKVDRGFFARPNSPRRTNTIPLSPVTGITLKKICYATIFAVADTSPFFIGYTALNILYIQGLLHATPYVFKFYADICQVQDFFYLVTYIICRKNIVFDEKKKNFYFFILCAYIRRTIKYVNLTDCSAQINLAGSQKRTG